MPILLWMIYPYVMWSAWLAPTDGSLPPEISEPIER
jgi:hypothetical protein